MNKVYDFIELSFGELFYPNEQPKNTTYYSSFFIELKSLLENTMSYEFYAVQDGKLEILLLRRVSFNLFVVNHNAYGDIYFSIGYFDEKHRYVGASKEKLTNFIRLFPLDNDELNFLCEFKKFFFVGYVDQSIRND